MELSGFFIDRSGGGLKVEEGTWRSVPRGLRLQSAILKTLAYAAVFNYALTKNETFKYLIFSNFQFSIFQAKAHPPRVDNFQSNLNSQFANTLTQLKNTGVVQQRDGYYFLSGMESSVKQRRERENISQKKLSIGKKFCRWARLIPTVKLIGVSGALAMRNAHEEDDIDLFIVAQAGTVWITRFLTVLLAELMGVRRRPEGGSLNVRRFLNLTSDVASPRASNSVKDKICLNMFVDEQHMSIPPAERDLFSAHEVVQMKPIYNSRGMYERFLWENRWVKEYLPNAIHKIRNERGEMRKTQRSRILNSQFSILNSLVSLFEKTVKKLQLNYMQSKVTNEVISDGYLRFHPVDARRIILRRYSELVSKLHSGLKSSEFRLQLVKNTAKYLDTTHDF